MKQMQSMTEEKGEEEKKKKQKKKRVKQKRRESQKEKLPKEAELHSGWLEVKLSSQSLRTFAVLLWKQTLPQASVFLLLYPSSVSPTPIPLSPTTLRNKEEKIGQPTSYTRFYESSNPPILPTVTLDVRSTRLLFSGPSSSSCSSSSSSFPFSIVSPAGTYHFAAASSEDRHIWMDTLSSWVNSSFHFKSSSRSVSSPLPNPISVSSSSVP